MKIDVLNASSETNSPAWYSRCPQYIAALSATLGSFALGNVLAWTSPTQKSITNGYYGFPVSQDEFSWIGSLISIGAAISTIPTGFLLDVIGRKYTMLVVALPFAAGWTLVTYPVNIGMLYAGRLITGFCAGLFCVACPLYIGEISETQIRGILGTIFQLMMVLGIEFTYIIGGFTDLFTVTIISMLVPFLFILLFMWVPETPQYYIKCDNLKAANKSLKWLRGGKNIDVELEEMVKNLKNTSTTIPFLTSLKSTASKRAIFISMGLMLFQQLSGIRAVISYTVAIFDSSGYNFVTSNTSTMIVGAVLVIFTIIAALVIEKLGRKILMLISLSTMFVCSIAIGVSMHYIQTADVHFDVTLIGWIPLLSLCLYVAGYTVGAGSVAWLYLGEIFPVEIKSAASSCAVMFHWVLGFIVTRLYPQLQESIGPLTFLIFAGFLFLGVIFVWFFMLETRGKTLEEIQNDLSS